MAGLYFYNPQSAIASVVRPNAKKKKPPKPNPSGLAYVRAALGLSLEVSFDAVNTLPFSMSRHIRIEHNICYSVIFFFFALNLRAKLLFLSILKLF